MASNVDAVRAAIDAWNAQDRDRYMSLFRPDVRLHGFPEGVNDAATLADFFAGFWEAVPDAKIDPGEMLEQGDKAAAHFTIRGTHEGELMGVQPSHRAIEFEVITIMRFDEDGRIAERWNAADFLTMLQQIGGVPAPA